MDLKTYIENDEDATKKRKLIATTISKALKAKKDEVIETEDSTMITVDCKSEYVKDTRYEIVVSQDYIKKYCRGMQHAIFIIVTKETNSHRNTDTTTVELNRLSEPEFLLLLNALKERFGNLDSDKKGC